MSEDFESLIWTLEQIGLCYRQLRLHNKAISSFQKMLQFSVLQKSTSNLVKAFDNLGVENYYLDDILKSRRYHSRALLDANVDLKQIYAPLLLRSEQEKRRIKLLFSRKPPLFKLELILTILSNYEIWSKDSSYEEYRMNLGVFEEDAILNNSSLVELPELKSQNPVFSNNLYSKIKSSRSRVGPSQDSNQLEINRLYLNQQIVLMKRRCNRAPIYTANFTALGNLQCLVKKNPLKSELARQGVLKIEPLRNQSLLSTEASKRGILDTEALDQDRRKVITHLFPKRNDFETALCGGLGNSFISHQSQNKSANIFLQSAVMNQRKEDDTEFADMSVKIDPRATKLGQDSSPRKRFNYSSQDAQGEKKEICFDYINKDLKQQILEILDQRIDQLKFYVRFILERIDSQTNP